ncbi:LytTR family DNA-binding domain-containing protein [Algivirga pacifica]
MKVRCIAVDDEPLALELLSSYIQKTPFLELMGAYDSSLKAMEHVQREEVDLLFLDIHMPDLSGLEFSRTLNKERVIFTTAYQEHALEGYKVNAIDYLLKPFTYQEFLVAAQKALKLFELIKGREEEKENVSVQQDYLFVKSEYKLRKVLLNDILYIEGLKDYIKILTKEEMILCLSSLKGIEQKLPEDRFMRVHRSYIVALEKIEMIERSRVVFGDTYIPISEQYKEKFNKYLNSRML